MRAIVATGVMGMAVLLAGCSGGGGSKTNTPTIGGGSATVGASSTAARGTLTPLVSVAAGTSTPPAGAISIDAPAEGATVKVPIAVSGSANVFEAALVVEVIGGMKDLVCERHVQATSGSGTPGTWSTTMAFAPDAVRNTTAQSDVAEIRAFDFSAKDGSEQDVVTRQVHVSPELPAIVIDSPRCNASFGPTTAIEVTGTAFVFEAALNVELRNAGGQAFLQQHILASIGTERGTWSAAFDLSQLPAGGGAYDLVAYDLSARDGSIENEFSIPITVTP